MDTHAAPGTEASTAAPAGPAQEGGHGKPNYMFIWFLLFVLTMVEVGVAYLGLSKRLLVITLIVLALWKAALVAMYYMHLRWEPRRLVLTVLAPLPLALILVFAVLTEF